MPLLSHASSLVPHRKVWEKRLGGTVDKWDEALGCWALLEMHYSHLMLRYLILLRCDNKKVLETSRDA
jgi:hypothetical protein